ncbi:TetR/AcrR family transcriptional regulator [Candidatus Poribacteria bacterium]|nr:TetR/AcrR family transcriptional regulator [Candidatus Poribacteria bacterium]
MKRERERGDTGRRILQTASELLEREGMESVSIRRIAKIVDVTPMAIYNHYPSLEALLLALYERGVERLTHQIWKAVARAEAPPDKLRAMIRAYVGFGIRNPHYYSLLFGSKFIQKYLWDRHPRSLVMQNFWAPFTEIIEACQEAGAIDPGANPQELATHIWSSIHGYVGFLIIGRLQQLWQTDEQGITEMMEKHLLRFL